MGPLWHRCCDELILVSQIDRRDFREEEKNTDDESGNHRHHLSRFYGILEQFCLDLNFSSPTFYPNCFQAHM